MWARGKNSSGFTLLELMVTLAIVAFALTLLPPMFSAGRSNTQLRQATRDIVNGLRQARSNAIVDNRESTFTLNLAERSYTIGAIGAGQPLGSGIDLELLTARSELSGGRAGQIRFYPDGGSSGGEIRISRNAVAYIVTVDWLTGAVRLGDPE